MFSLIEQHYKDNYKQQVKTMLRRAGSWQNAEDIVQESYARAFQFCKSYDKERPFEGWFVTILNNTLKQYKSDERRLGMAVEYDEDYDSVWDFDEEASDILDRIKADIAAQPQPYRDVYTLYFLNQYAPREIVQVVDITNNAVRSAVKRFKKVLEAKYG